MSLVVTIGNRAGQRIYPASAMAAPGRRGYAILGLLSVALVGHLGLPLTAGASELPAEESITLPASGSSSRSTSNSAGTTINQQNNTQTNNDQFFGFGPGIQCPTPSLGVSLYGGGGSGGSGLDGGVSTSAYGGMVTFSTPLGGRNQSSCAQIGEAQIEAVRAQIDRTQMEAAKTLTDINLVTIQQCINILQTARLSGQFVDACNGVELVRQQAAAPPPASTPAPPAAPSADQAWQQLHAAVPVWDLDTALTSLTTLKQQPNTCIAQFADRFAQTLRQQGVEGFRQINPIKRALNQQQGCSLEIRPYDFSP